MKKVIVHWVEIRTLEVPDECPTDDVDKFEKWMYTHSPTSEPYKMFSITEPIRGKINFVVKSETRDFEIVSVEAIAPSNEYAGSGEDKYQR